MRGGGLHVAACVRREMEGKPRRRYQYQDLGSTAYIQLRGNALLRYRAIRIAVFLGWLGC